MQRSPDDDSSQRPRKRTRQACKPCRRKKSKCSGQRPRCSTCVRLRQACEYPPEPLMPDSSAMDDVGPSLFSDPVVGQSDAPWVNATSSVAEGQRHFQQRLDSLETTLAELVDCVKDGLHSTSRLPLSPSEALSSSPSTSRRPHSAIRENLMSTTMASNLASRPSHSPGCAEDSYVPLPIRSWETALALAEVYLLRCHCQPLPLFHRDTFISTFPNRSLDVVYAVLAAALRFADHGSLQPGPPDPGRDAVVCRDKAAQVAMASVSGRFTELSTLQTLCLLAYIHFNDGDMTQCRVYGSISMALVRSSRLHREPHGAYAGNDRDLEERRRCYWSIVMLNRLVGEPATVLAPLGVKQSSPPYPASSGSPTSPRDANTPDCQSTATSDPHAEQQNIMSLMIQLSDVWFKAQDYIRGSGAGIRTPRSVPPPWQPSSAYCQTLLVLTDLSCQIPTSEHRNRFIRFSSVGAEELEESRGYWAPWILCRFLHHTIICILNHPVLIMLQIQASGGDLSEVFLQQTTSSRVYYSSLLLRFIEVLEAKNFTVSDPLFGYCAAVLATIELYQSFVETTQAAASKRKENYEQCLGFIRRLGDRWPYMRQVVLELQRLMESTSASYDSKMASEQESSISVDISGFVQILLLSNFCSAGNTVPSFGPMFAARLGTPDLPRRTNLSQLPNMTEMDSVEGSPAGQAFDMGGGDGVNQYALLPNANELTQFQMPDEMFVPAAQFFGGLYQTASPWDTIIGMHDDAVMAFK